jgi:sarcosine oxidase subunit beta
LHRFVPATRGLGLKKAWAATIEYTPDHLPIIGPLLLGDGTEVDGASIASACGHGMMWARPCLGSRSIFSLTGATEVVERPSDLRMDRFDADGRSALVDPIALPFPSPSATTDRHQTSPLRQSQTSAASRSGSGIAGVG